MIERRERQKVRKRYREEGGDKREREGWKGKREREWKREP